MRRFWYQPTASWLLLLAVLVVLLFMAGLQYQWVSQVSEAEEARLQASLRVSTERFSEDFNREIARIYLSLQMDAASYGEKRWETFATRYDAWFANAPYPELVETVYMTQPNERGGLELLRYNPQTRLFETVPWPASFDRVWMRLAQAQAQQDGQPRPRLDEQVLEPVAAELPALLVPLARPVVFSGTQNKDFEVHFLGNRALLRLPSGPCFLSCEPQLSDDQRLVHLIIGLNQTYVTQIFLPKLAQRHFATNGSLDYNLRIAPRSDVTKTVYQSNNQGQTTGPADAEIALFSVQADELSRLLVNNEVQFDTSQSAQQPGPIAIGVVRSSALVQGSESAASEGAWQLVATHHSGSLAAAVSAGRLRNLLLSFSTLLLLAASFVLVALLARRAQRLAQQKMDFVTTISHELRTPLAVICSAGDNLAHGIVSQPEQTQQYGSVIRNEGQRLSAMVEQVLEFAGVQAGRKRYVSEPVDMRQVLERSLAAHQLQFNLDEFVVERQIAPNLPLVLGDEVALRNVLQNLICNGMKYSQNERWLLVRASTAAGRHGPEVQISVEDRGIGIAPEDLPHIFEPFYRAGDVVAAQIRGSGLGLALVQHTVAAHGGRISVTSQPGVGSTFTMHLPAMSEPAEAKEHDSGVKSYEPSHLAR